jgi:ribosomal-protein-alanine acetyltransferase
MTDSDWVITPLGTNDLKAALAIDRQSPSPWTFAQLEGELYGPAGWRYAGYERKNNVLAGFLLARDIAGEAEILRLGVDKRFKRQGLATTLLTHFMMILGEKGISKCHLEFRSKNHAAKCLYEKSGFVMTGQRKKYYTDPADDALSMTCIIPNP